MEKIKNCPFCGAVPRVTAWHHGAYVSCWNPACPCTPTTLVCHTEEEAINFWNNRHGEEDAYRPGVQRMTMEGGQE